MPAQKWRIHSARNWLGAAPSRSSTATGRSSASRTGTATALRTPNWRAVACQGAVRGSVRKLAALAISPLRQASAIRPWRSAWGGPSVGTMPLAARVRSNDRPMAEALASTWNRPSASGRIRPAARIAGRPAIASSCVWRASTQGISECGSGRSSTPK